MKFLKRGSIASNGPELILLAAFLVCFSNSVTQKRKKMCKGIFLYDQIASYFDLTFDSTVVMPSFLFRPLNNFHPFLDCKKQQSGLLLLDPEQCEVRGDSKTRGFLCGRASFIMYFKKDYKINALKGDL